MSDKPKETPPPASATPAPSEATDAAAATALAQRTKGLKKIEELARAKGADAREHSFWGTQPVQQFTEANGEVVPIGPIETKTLDDVLKDPLPIASTLEWWVPDPTNDADLVQIYELLRDNYVEDDDSLFRFNYSLEFLRWALMPPGYFPEWHVAVRKKADKKMLAFISGIPIRVKMGPETKLICEINFLCVHKNLRDKKLSPILIKEVTRRVNLHDIWQAIYTAGVVLPKPFASAQYYHRSLNPVKLVAIGFSRIPERFQKFQKPMDMMVRNFAVPAKTETRGLRPMEAKDVDHVAHLLNKFLIDSGKFAVAPEFSVEDVRHWLLPIKDVVYSYVVERDGKITDFISFYNLPSTIIGNAKYKDLRAAYTYYYAANTVSLLQLMTDALVLAKQHDFDVFNTLDILDNEAFIEQLKFGKGDGTLQYYFYNWRFPALESKEVGLVML